MNETTLFNFSVSELCQRADKLVMSYKRDQESFLRYGYTDEMGLMVTQKTAQLKEFLSDDYYAGLQKEATDAKTQVRTQLEKHIIDLRNRAKLCYGANSTDYNMFRFGKLSHLADYALVQYAFNVVQVARPRMEKLGERNVSPALLEAILEQRIHLDDAIDIQAEAITNRREKKHARIKLSNELYSLLSELCEVGKMIWKGQNEAYYNDYVIYGSSKTLESVGEEVESTTESSDSI